MRHRRGDEHRARAGSPSRAGARGPRRAACAPRPGRSTQAGGTSEATSASRTAGCRSSASSAATSRCATAHGNWITYNGEIYNYLELRKELGEASFETDSDTEVILRAYAPVGAGLPRPAARHVRVRALGRARADASSSRATASGSSRSTTRVVDGVFYCASEAKALLPFLPGIETDPDALKDYLAFQFTLGGKTMFRGVHELLPAHTADDPERLDLGPAATGR